MSRHQIRKDTLRSLSKKLIGLRQSWKIIQETRRRTRKQWPRIGLRKRLPLFVILLVVSIHVDAQVSFGRATAFNADWRFALV